MGMFKGKRDFEKYQAGKKINLKHSVWAKCYECSGFDMGGIDCDVPTCPIYPYNPYKGVKQEKGMSK